MNPNFIVNPYASKRNIWNFLPEQNVGLSPFNFFSLLNESSSKMMKNAFYFPSKALFGFEIFSFFVLTFGSVEKRLQKKVMINFQIYDVTGWTKNNNNVNIARYSRSKGNQIINLVS